MPTTCPTCGGAPLSPAFPGEETPPEPCPTCGAVLVWKFVRVPGVKLADIDDGVEGER